LRAPLPVVASPEALDETIAVPARPWRVQRAPAVPE